MNTRNPPPQERPQLRWQVKAAAIGIGVVSLLVLAKCGMDQGWIPKPGFLKPAVPEASASLAGDVNQGLPRETYELPMQPVASFQGCARVQTIPWNGASALPLANGGARTTDGSLVDQFSGGCLQIERQDDYAVIRDNLVKFESEYRDGGPMPSSGTPFAIIMGDGLPAFAAALEGKADIVVVGVIGFSYGEDKCMGRPLNGDPQKARGSLIAAVPMDGDQNICLKWAADNGIPVNTGPGYDENAINFVETASFVEADEKYINGYCENRNVIRDGSETSETKRVCVDGVATWTPGDVVVVERKGGLVSWASTREYNQQMPTILIANKRWAEHNKAFVVGVLRAADRAAFQMRGPDASYRTRAGMFMAQVHGGAGGDEADPAFWATYFVGRETTDAQGNRVTLGGSRVITLAEARDFLGMTPGTLNIYKSVYEIFGDYAKAFYPQMLPSYPAYEDVVTTEYVRLALAGVSTARSATPAPFQRNESISNVTSQRPYSILFRTGSAEIDPASLRELRELAGQAGMTNLRIRVDGHTDNVGDPTQNMELSRRRADAVARWLTETYPETFPATRIQSRGYGDTTPKVGNETEADRRTNRRVEVILGN